MGALFVDADLFVTTLAIAGFSRRWRFSMHSVWAITTLGPGALLLSASRKAARTPGGGGGTRGSGRRAHAGVVGAAALDGDEAWIAE